MRSLLSIATALFLLLAFASTSRASWYDKSAVELFMQVMEIIESSGPDAATTGELERFVEDYPRSSVTDEAFLRLAGIYMDQKDYSRASKTFGRLIVRFPSSRFGPEALYGLAYCNYRSGSFDDSLEMLRAVIESDDASISVKVKARLLLKEVVAIKQTSLSMRGSSGDYAIGAVLPLKGDYAEFGKKALFGMLLAADVFGARSSSVDVLVRDHGPTPRTARESVRELGDERRVVGLVGPILSATAPAVARAAESYGVPVITLSQRAGLPGVGEYVFRNFITIEEQAATLAKYSFEILGKRSYAVLYPNNSYGKGFLRAFASEVGKLGGEIVGKKSYKAGQADFAKELTELFGVEVVERMEGRRRIREYSTTVEVDALFIPDSYEIIGQVAPYLGFYDIKDITLLGSNGWNSPELLKLARDYVEGAVIVDGFFRGSNRPATVDFISRFKEQFGYEPGLLEAESYDAAMMLLASIDREDEGSMREAVRDRLLNIWQYEGATGDISFDPDGEARKPLFIMTVEEGRLKEIERPFEVLTEGDGSTLENPVPLMPEGVEILPDGIGGASSGF